MNNAGTADKARQGSRAPRKALVFGEALWDLLPSGPVLGGAPLNFAYRLGSLGVPTRFVSQVGTDDLGDQTLAAMRSLGMDASLVSRTDALPTATVIVELDEERNPSYTIVEDVAYDAVPWSEELASAARESDILCFGTLAQRDLRSRGTLRRLVAAFSGTTILVDINLRPRCYTDETIRWSLEQGTIAKLNDEELIILADIYSLRGDDMVDLAGQLRLSAQLDTIVVTLGRTGAFAMTGESDAVIVPGFIVQVDDPCGAGDAFAGAFMASAMDGLSLETAITRANALGALVATQPGATQTVTEEQMTRLMAEGRRVEVSASELRINRKTQSRGER